MSEEKPSNADILTALQGMWGQQKDLILGVEKRLRTEIKDVEKRLDTKIDDAERRIGERVSREIHDRPVVVHVDMGRVS
jgi:hypothetical protein